MATSKASPPAGNEHRPANSTVHPGTVRSMPPITFAAPDQLPHGFLYRPDFLSQTEEANLLGIFHSLEFAAYDYHGFRAKRRVVRFGVNYDIDTKLPNDTAPAIPDFLLSIRERAANFARCSPEEFVQAMVSEYSPGTPIGWHRDAPQFGTIVGISLASACRMRLKPYESAGAQPADSAGGKALSIQLEPRSIYVISDDARSAWQHSIPPVNRLRYSITFRTLRSSAKRKAA